MRNEIEFTEDQKNLKCNLHGKKIEIIYKNDSDIDYKFCCHSFRSNFFSILNPNQKKKLEESDNLK